MDRNALFAIVAVVVLAVGGMYFLGSTHQREVADLRLQLETLRGQREAEAKKGADTAATLNRQAADIERAKQRAVEMQVALDKMQAEREAAAATKPPLVQRDLGNAAARPGEPLFAQAQKLERDGKGPEAVKVYVRAARSGDGKAAKRLTEIYRTGIPGVEPDYPEYQKWSSMARVLGERL